MPAISSKTSGLKVWLGDPSTYPIIAVITFACSMATAFTVFTATRHNDGELIVICFAELFCDCFYVVRL